MVASQFPGKDNTALPDFQNLSGHGSCYSVLGIYFSLLSTPRPPENAYNPPKA